MDAQAGGEALDPRASELVAAELEQLSPVKPELPWWSRGQSQQQLEFGKRVAKKIAAASRKLPKAKPQVKPSQGFGGAAAKGKNKKTK